MNRILVASSLLAFLASAVPAQQGKPGDKPAKGDHAAAPIIIPNTSPQNRAPKKSNPWFPETEIDLGTFFGAEHATGVFQFENPNDSEVLWRGLRGSCTCAKAVVRVGGRTYLLSSKPRPNELVRIDKAADGSETREPVSQIAIGPHERGEVEVHLDIPPVPGPRQAYLDVHTSDKRLPQFKLKWKAKSAKLFLVTPAEINLNKMSWNEKREFTAMVTSPLHPNFEILGMDGGSEAFDVDWEKKVEGERAVWTIRGTYGPVGSDTKAGGGLLKFRTNVRNGATFQLRVMALIEGPLEIKPGGFLPLGMIRRSKELTKEIVFTPNDGSKIEATKLTFEKLTIPQEFVSAESHADGNSLVVVLTVKAGAPRGLLKGDLVVDLNHPAVKQKRIMFNGFVR